MKIIAKMENDEFLASVTRGELCRLCGINWRDTVGIGTKLNIDKMYDVAVNLTKAPHITADVIEKLSQAHDILTTFQAKLADTVKPEQP